LSGPSQPVVGPIPDVARSVSRLVPLFVAEPRHALSTQSRTGTHGRRVGRPPAFPCRHHVDKAERGPAVGLSAGGGLDRRPVRRVHRTMVRGRGGARRAPDGPPGPADRRVRRLRAARWRWRRLRRRRGRSRQPHGQGCPRRLRGRQGTAQPGPGRPQQARRPPHPTPTAPSPDHRQPRPRRPQQARRPPHPTPTAPSPDQRRPRPRRPQQARPRLDAAATLGHPRQRPHEPRPWRPQQARPRPQRAAGRPTRPAPGTLPEPARSGTAASGRFRADRGLPPCSRRSLQDPDLRVELLEDLRGREEASGQRRTGGRAAHAVAGSCGEGRRGTCPLRAAVARREGRAAAGRAAVRGRPACGRHIGKDRDPWSGSHWPGTERPQPGRPRLTRAEQPVTGEPWNASDAGRGRPTGGAVPGQRPTTGWRTRPARSFGAGHEGSGTPARSTGTRLQQR
jgi:hypothetical protein